MGFLGGHSDFDIENTDGDIYCNEISLVTTLRVNNPAKLKRNLKKLQRVCKLTAATPPIRMVFSLGLLTMNPLPQFL